MNLNFFRNYYDIYGSSRGKHFFRSDNFNVFHSIQVLFRTYKIFYWTPFVSLPEEMIIICFSFHVGDWTILVRMTFQHVNYISMQNELERFCNAHDQVNNSCKVYGLIDVILYLSILKYGEHIKLWSYTIFYYSNIIWNHEGSWKSITSTYVTIIYLNMI